MESVRAFRHSGRPPNLAVAILIRRSFLAFNLQEFRIESTHALRLLVIEHEAQDIGSRIVPNRIVGGFGNGNRREIQIREEQTLLIFSEHISERRTIWAVDARIAPPAWSSAFFDGESTSSSIISGETVAQGAMT
jgi:hypothetical protein